MTPRELIASFDTFAEAPDGVERLRELILRLAVRGKLVPQDPTDEPVRVHLARLATARRQLVSTGRIRSSKPLPPVSPGEEPFTVPTSWVWVRLNDVAWPQPGFAFKAHLFREAGDGMPLIRIRDIDQSTTQARYVGEFGTEFLVNPGDFLIGMDGNFNVRQWRGPEALLNQRVCRLIFYGHTAHAFIAFALQERLNEVHGSKAYTTVQHLSGGQIASSLIPLPPQAEQHRIIARVDELMGLLDRLEAARSRRNRTRAAARDSALGALREASTTEELEAAWRRYSGRMEDLLCEPEDITPMRQTVLQLGVRGRLATQDPRDEPASMLLERAGIERARLVDAGTIRSQEPLPPLPISELPYDIPAGWEWCRIQDCGEVKLGRQRSPEHQRGAHMIPYLRVANVQEARLDLSDVKQMNFTPDEQVVFALRTGDVLLNEGQSRELVGRPALYRGELPHVCFQNSILRFRPSSSVLSEYALIVFLTYLHEGRFMRAATQTTNVAHLSAGRLSPLEFPLPPLEEQRRIVTRVEALLDLQDRLRERLSAARTAHATFAATVVHKLHV